MITFNLKTSFSLLLIGIVIGFYSSFLFAGCERGNNDVANEKIIRPKELEQQAATSEARYQEKISALENKNHQLQQELKVTKQQLALVKAKTKQRESTIKKIIEPKGFPAKELLEKVSSSSLAIDTSLSPCDSLAQEVSGYIEENFQKDSLYEMQAIIQDSIIAAKDSIITLNVVKYSELKKIFTQSLVQQEKLIIENKLLQKKFKRQKFRNKLATIGVAIVTGLTTNYLMRH